MQTFSVQLFAAYADIFGARAVTVQLPAGSTVSDLVLKIRKDQNAGRLPAEPLVAVNLSYAPYSQTLSEGDSVALIPPVAGG